MKPWSHLGCTGYFTKIMPGHSVVVVDKKCQNQLEALAYPQVDSKILSDVLLLQMTIQLEAPMNPRPGSGILCKILPCQVHTRFTLPLPLLLLLPLLLRPPLLHLLPLLLPLPPHRCPLITLLPHKYLLPLLLPSMSVSSTQQSPKLCFSRSST